MSHSLAVSTHFSSTSTFAPLAAMRAAVARPPMPLPMMTASYSTSVGASAGSCATSEAGGYVVCAAAALMLLRLVVWAVEVEGSALSN